MTSSGPVERALPESLLWAKEESRVVFAENDQPRTANVEMVPATTDAAPASDERLMSALKVRDTEALAELFRRYARLVFCIGLRILRDRGETEEIVQDVFVSLYEKAALFDENKGSAKAWLLQIAHHRALDRLEYLGRRNFYLGTDAGLLADTLMGTADLERELASKECRERLKQSFEKLSDRQRLVLELFFFQEFSFPEIATCMGESLENTRHHYYRGIQRLRKDVYVKKLRDKRRHDGS